MPEGGANQSDRARKRGARDGGEEAERLAEAYWRLWRRNWRPPFSTEDRPMSERPRAAKAAPRGRGGS